MRTISVEALRDLGFTVLHASDGAGALDLLRSHPGVSLLFTDVVMPGMSGRQLADAAGAEHPGLKVGRTGGTGRGRSRSLVAPLAALLLREINADVAFLSCAGIDPEKGFTNSNWEEAEVKHAMLAAAGRALFLADHSKVGHVGTARIAGLERADALITDAGIASDAARALEGKGLRVIQA